VLSILSSTSAQAHHFESEARPMLAETCIVYGKGAVEFSHRHYIAS